MEIDEQYMTDFCMVNAPHMVDRVGAWMQGNDDSFSTELANHMADRIQTEVMKLKLWQAIAHMTDSTFL